MALAFSLVDTWDDGKRVHVCGTVTASGNYATGGGHAGPVAVSGGGVRGSRR